MNKGTQGATRSSSPTPCWATSLAVQTLKSGEIDLAEFSSGPLSDAVPGYQGAEPASFCSPTWLTCFATWMALVSALPPQPSGAGFVVLAGTTVWGAPVLLRWLQPIQLA